MFPMLISQSIAVIGYLTRVGLVSTHATVRSEQRDWHRGGV